jgi:hypothetical protein
VIRLLDGQATYQFGLQDKGASVVADSDLGNRASFDRDWFVAQLAERTAHELDFWWSRWKVETIRALAYDCHPWHGGIGLCLLTSREEFPDETYGKWSLGDWRLQDFTSSIGAEGWPAVKHLAQLMLQYYEGKTTTDTERTPAERADVIFQCCAKALRSETVAACLKRYRLSADFEVGVFDPDKSAGKNYCEL